MLTCLGLFALAVLGGVVVFKFALIPLVRANPRAWRDRAGAAALLFWLVGAGFAAASGVVINGAATHPDAEHPAAFPYKGKALYTTPGKARFAEPWGMAPAGLGFIFCLVFVRIAEEELGKS